MFKKNRIFFIFYVVFITNLVFIATFTLLHRAAAQPQNIGFLHPPYFGSAEVKAMRQLGWFMSINTPALAWSSAVAVAGLQTVPHLACQSPARQNDQASHLADRCWYGVRC